MACPSPPLLLLCLSIITIAAATRASPPVLPVASAASASATSATADEEDAIPLGVNYGTVANNLPSPAEAVKLIQSTRIRKVKLFSVEPEILRAMAGTELEAMVGIGDDQIKPLASSVASAQSFVEAHLKPFFPATKITFLSVGNEVLSSSRDGEMIYDLPIAMENLHAACEIAGMPGIKITTPHSMGLLQSSVPPSNGTFGEGPIAILRPILSFLARTGSPYLTNAYPFFGYLANPNATNLEYALFGGGGGAARYDPITKLSYTNMFDAQIDAIYAAIARLGFHNISVAVGETGWPSQGDPYEPGVGLSNAQIFNSHIVRRSISRSGTPLKPHVPIDTYIFALFNENLKPGAASEKHYGLFNPDMTPVYDCGIMKADPKGSSSSSSSSSSSPPAFGLKARSSKWCVAKPGVSNSQLQAILSWTCQQPGTDCASIQRGQPCFHPNSLSSHASFVMNSYYQIQGRHPWNCDFSGSGLVVYKDPSYAPCKYKAY